MSTDNQIPERLQKILDLISDYHKHVLQNTLDTQSPQYIDEIRKILRTRNSELNNYIKWQNYPKNPDEKFNALIQDLEEFMQPWDSSITTLVPEWCNKIFVEYPFSLSLDHIQNLYKNSQEPIDAVSSESDSA